MEEKKKDNGSIDRRSRMIGKKKKKKKKALVLESSAMTGSGLGWPGRASAGTTGYKGSRRTDVVTLLYMYIPFFFFDSGGRFFKCPEEILESTPLLSMPTMK